MSDGPRRKGPLAGIKVVELAAYVSAPFATMMMADLGADVIKIEPPKGDAFRRFGRAGTPVSPHFLNVNRGKQGMVLDLKDPAGIETLRGLLKDADVLVSNWRPSVADRLGLSDDSLAEANPKLIRVYVSGFGTSGPSVDAPVYDAIIQAHVGSAESSPPAIAPAYVIDKLAASIACQATVAALFDRERNGNAERIDLALLDTAAYITFVDVMANHVFVDVPPVAARNQASVVRAVQTADGWLIVTPVTSGEIRRTCEAVGRPELADELLVMKDAIELTKRLFDELEVIMRAQPTAHWLNAFRAKDVPAGACLTIEQHLHDAQVVHNHIYDIADEEGFGRTRRVRYPAIFSGYGELWPRGGPPALRPVTSEHA